MRIGWSHGVGQDGDGLGRPPQEEGEGQLCRGHGVPAAMGVREMPLEVLCVPVPSRKGLWAILFPTAFPVIPGLGLGAGCDANGPGREGCFPWELSSAGTPARLERLGQVRDGTAGDR